MVDHSDEGSDDFIVNLVELCGFVSVHVFAVDGKLQPNLSLGGFGFAVGKLTDEMGLVPPFTPGFG